MAENKRLVIIGANDFQNQLILKAKELGYETHVFAWQDGAVGEKTADFFYPISIVEKEKILEKCREIQPVGVCSIASDLATLTVNYVAEKLGLNGNPDEITKQCTNKYEMRKRMKEAGVKTPGFVKVGEGFTFSDVAELKFPVIVKPTDRSGSRGIRKVEREEDLADAIKEACGESFEKAAIVEEYIEGDEYSSEGISFDGEHHILALTKKYTTGAPHFIETGHREPAEIDEKKAEEVRENVKRALTALGIKNGASHTEFKLNEDGEFGIIEIGARMGGDCIGSDLVQISTGMDFMKMVIDVACGKAPDFTRVTEPRPVNIRFIFTKDDLAEMKKFQKAHPERIVRISEMEMENLEKATDSSNRVGYYIYTDK